MFFCTILKMLITHWIYIFFALLWKIRAKKLCGLFSNPPPPYVDKHVHFLDPPPLLTGYVVCVWHQMVLLQKSPLLFCIKNGLHKIDASLVYFLPSSFERRATKLNGGDILFTRSHPQNRSIVTFGRMHVIQNWIATPRHSLKIEGN